MAATLGAPPVLAQPQGVPSATPMPGLSIMRPSTPDFEALAAQPGTEVRREQVDGKDSVVLRRAGVELRYGRAGSVGVDSNGPGMLCLWRHSLAVKSVLDFCGVPAADPAQAALSWAIGALNDFIVANSLVATLLAEVEAAAAGLMAVPAAVGVLPAEQREARCKAIMAPDQMAGGVLRSPQDYRAMVTRQLAVPRPPVMNPCL
ncbi:hypothetical protein [Roseomonas sp. 18066]|uniref:hypothetical protein n=1 Tax=Roseomonas sp. 18066 TaxID=2681412 RepID=UPI0013589F59|nr:hypothetical protein [Roseomonas sp. 18066]